MANEVQNGISGIKRELINFNNNNSNNNNNNVYASPDVAHSEEPKKLIPELCNHFYHLGWASGTGGGLSIRQNGFIYCAPSGVQKERIRPEDMFVLNEEGSILEGPQNPKLKCSECLTLFMVPFKLRNAGCCIHSHSINANLVTALYSEKNLRYQRDRRRQPAAEGINYGDEDVVGRERVNPKYIEGHSEFRISNQEMIKGIKKGSSDEAMQYTDTLVVPIIDNVLHERDLAGAMHEAVSKYPLTNAVLVRNHGVYVWGKTWAQAKSMAECYEYLFRLKLEALKCGFHWMLNE